MKFQYFFLMIFISFFFTACGGGGEDDFINEYAEELYTGYFVDSPVINLNYKCSSESIIKKTDIDGSFECNSNDDVYFYIGNLSIGNSIILDKDGKIISPYNIYNSEVEAIKLAQLLQTIDKDNILENGIELDDNMVYLLNGEFNNTIPFNNDDIDIQIESIIKKSLIDYELAKQHLDDTLNSLDITVETNIDNNITDYIESNITNQVDSNISIPSDNNITDQVDNNISIPSDDNITDTVDNNVTDTIDDTVVYIPLPPQPPSI